MPTNPKPSKARWPWIEKAYSQGANIAWYSRTWAEGVTDFLARAEVRFDIAGDWKRNRKAALNSLNLALAKHFQNK